MIHSYRCLKLNFLCLYYVVCTVLLYYYYYYLALLSFFLSFAQTASSLVVNTKKFTKNVKGQTDNKGRIKRDSKGSTCHVEPSGQVQKGRGGPRLTSAAPFVGQGRHFTDTV